MKGKLLAVALIWLFVFGAFAVCYKLIYQPYARNKAESQVEQQKQELVQSTVGTSRYVGQVKFLSDTMNASTSVTVQDLTDKLANRDIYLNALAQDMDRTSVAMVSAGAADLTICNLDTLIADSWNQDIPPATTIAIASQNNSTYTVVVANREFLAKKPDLARLFLESLFDARYDKSEVALAGAMDNYGYFGISEKTHGHIEDFIRHRTRSLVQDNLIQSPKHMPNLLYFDGILKDMFNTNYRPKASVESLSNEQWAAMVPMMDPAPVRLVFQRGATSMTNASKQRLDDLAGQASGGGHYCLVTGSVAVSGNVEANAKLAHARAQSVMEYLIGQGFPESHVRIDNATPQGDMSVTVSFVQRRY